MSNEVRHLFPMSAKARARYIRESAVFVELLERKAEFSLQTFGPGHRLLGVLDHIKKELVEVEKQPWDLMEWVDVIALAIDGAMRQGHTAQDLLIAIIEKQAIVETRKYPDWRTADPSKGIEHIRD